MDSSIQKSEIRTVVERIKAKEAVNPNIPFEIASCMPEIDIILDISSGVSELEATLASSSQDLA